MRLPAGCSRSQKTPSARNTSTSKRVLDTMVLAICIYGLRQSPRGKTALLPEVAWFMKTQELHTGASMATSRVRSAKISARLKPAGDMMSPKSPWALISWMSAALPRRHAFANRRHGGTIKGVRNHKATTSKQRIHDNQANHPRQPSKESTTQQAASKDSTIAEARWGTAFVTSCSPA